MRKVLSKMLLAVAVTTIAALGADNTLGTWKLNVGKSKLAPAPSPIKSLIVVREASDGGVKVTTTGERADGTKIDTTYTAKYDGTPATVTGAGLLYNTISIKQVNANTLTDERKNTGTPYNATGRMVVSNGGKTMTLTTKGTNVDGKEFASTLVLDKQ
jgi:hypothetical protein